MESIKCLECGSKNFRQEVKELFNRCINSKGKIIGFEDDLTHDFEFGKIRCVECDCDCDNVFKNIELKLLITNL